MGRDYLRDAAHVIRTTYAVLHALGGGGTMWSQRAGSVVCALCHKQVLGVYSLVNVQDGSSRAAALQQHRQDHYDELPDEIKVAISLGAPDLSPWRAQLEETYRS